VRFVADSLLEEAVASELVSAPRFPGNRVKYRELSSFPPSRASTSLKKIICINILRENSLDGRTGNFFDVIREINLKEFR